MGKSNGLKGGSLRTFTQLSIDLGYDAIFGTQVIQKVEAGDVELNNPDCGVFSRHPAAATGKWRVYHPVNWLVENTQPMNRNTFQTDHRSVGNVRKSFVILGLPVRLQRTFEFVRVVKKVKFTSGVIPVHQERHTVVGCKKRIRKYEWIVLVRVYVVRKLAGNLDFPAVTPGRIEQVIPEVEVILGGIGPDLLGKARRICAGSKAPAAGVDGRSSGELESRPAAGDSSTGFDGTMRSRDGGRGRPRSPAGSTGSGAPPR